jgi:hypothetical protein
LQEVFTIFSKKSGALRKKSAPTRGKSAAVIPTGVPTGIGTAPLIRLVEEEKIQDDYCDNHNPPGIASVGTAGQISKKHVHHLTPFDAEAPFV